MVMEILWNGYEMIILPCCCSFIMVSVVIRWLVMGRSLCLNSLCVETLWTYKGKEVKRGCVPGKGSYSGGGYTGGSLYSSYTEGGRSLYTGGKYTGDGLYGGYSGDDIVVKVYTEDIVEVITFHVKKYMIKDVVVRGQKLVIENMRKKKITFITVFIKIKVQ